LPGEDAGLLAGSIAPVVWTAGSCPANGPLNGPLIGDAVSHGADGASHGAGPAVCGEQIPCENASITQSPAKLADKAKRGSYHSIRGVGIATDDEHAVTTLGPFDTDGGSAENG
jgi:hypothetical protein